jgi:glycosyltransferase involved in cell wall biosynthesis
MPHYVFDARVIQDHFPGIGRYAWNVLRALPEHLQGDEQLTVLHDPSAPNTRLPAVTSASTHPAVAYVDYRQPIFSAGNILKPLPVRGDVGHHCYYARPLRGGCSITTIYDAISFVHPELAPSARARWAIRLLHHLAIRASTALITISQSAAADLLRTFPAARGKLTVTPLAADPVFAPQTTAAIDSVRARFDLSRRFVLYLASNKPHKNLPRLIAAWGSVAQPDVTLVIAGHQDPRYREAQAAAQKLPLDARARFIGPVSDADAAALYSSCEMFVFPSLYEGFGLTPLEAMSCGAAVICANTSSLPEVTGDAALLVDPTDTRSIAAALGRALGDASLRAELRQRSLTQAARFSWSRTARETLERYRDIGH